jgi:hypothetical protein
VFGVLIYAGDLVLHEAVGSHGVAVDLRKDER